MADSTTIGTIIAEEAAAETSVAEALDAAQKARAALDERYRETFDKVSEGLVEERKEAAERVKAAARGFKDEIDGSLHNDIKTLQSGADRRIAEARSAVVTRFKEYVGK